ncbi:MAG: hypothetical protein JF625_24610, partial [Inquilinus limosus]|nr:hypothetical protein [Inquilinus limosus]
DMVAEGVPAYDPHGKQRTNANGHTHGPSTQLTDEHARLGWSDASMSGGIAVHVDGRKIAKIHPGLLVAAAIVRGARQAHYGAGFLGPLVKIDGPQQDLVNDPDGWLRARF